MFEMLLNTDACAAIRARVFGSKETLHAPHLVDVEVAEILRRYTAMGAIGEEQGRQALSNLGEINLLRYPHHVLLQRIWLLRHNLTAYDAAYVALAEALDAPLPTRYWRLARSSGHRAKIESI